MDECQTKRKIYCCITLSIMKRLRTIEFKAVRRFTMICVVLICMVISSSLEQFQSSSEYGQGDLVIGGMFPIFQSCSCNLSSTGCRVYPEGLFLAETMKYAVQMVNVRGILPFNLTLGYSILDTCSTLSVAVENALIFAKNRKKSDKGNRKSLQTSTSSVIGVVGAGTSELSLAVNNILSLYDIPQVGYASSATFLNDKSRYKTFLRVISPDAVQAKAIVQLIAHFQWNYISVISTDDHYAGPLRQAFLENARIQEICLSNDIVISNSLASFKVIKRHLINIKVTPNSNVILLLVSERNAKKILNAASDMNLINYIWIASDSWANALALIEQRLPVTKGGLGVFHNYQPVPGFIKYLQNQVNKHESLASARNDLWLRILVNTLKEEGISLKLNDPKTESLYRSVFARVNYVINSVFILSQAIRAFCLELTDAFNSTDVDKKEMCLQTIQPKSLLQFLFNKTIKAFSRNLTIDANGDPLCNYDIYNMQEQPRDQLNYIKIGEYDSETSELQLNESLTDFGQGKSHVPQSRCSAVCPLGYYVIRKRFIQCCWDCKLCPSNEISNVTMATSCSSCSDDHVANSNRSRCIYVTLQFVGWGQPWTMVLGFFSVLGFILSISVIAVFIRRRHSPVVRASCFEISIVLLLSIALGFLLPIFNLSKPSDRMCKASAFLFAVVFTTILSLTLAKINRTVLILNNRLVNQTKVFQTRVLLSKQFHFISVVVLTAIQIAICTAWLYQQPPRHMITKRSQPYPSRYLHCTSHTSYWFLVSSGFLIVLSLLCTILAFRSRNFPENYNHAKFVSLAMFTFDMVWLTFMGAYYGNREPGLHHPIIYACAILFSNLLLLLFFFAPKVYVIFCRPELNNARTFREMNFQHILEGTATRTTSRCYSLVSLQGHNNVYLMDCDQDGNNKAVQTPRIYTRDTYSQTDFKCNVKSSASLPQRLLSRFGSKRGFSESDASKNVDLLSKSSGLSHSNSYPLYDLNQSTSNTSNGLHMIEENTAFDTDNAVQTPSDVNDTINCDTFH